HLFLKYCIIFCSKYPKASVGLFGYIQRIYSLHQKHKGSLFWRHYDEEFRKFKMVKPKTPWNDYHNPTMTAVEEIILAQQARSDLFVKQVQPQQKQLAIQSRQQVKAAKTNKIDLPKNGSCHHWNAKFCKAGQNCKWSHICSYCGEKDHKAPACPSKP
ncbi:MAG: hypothetical protein GY705_08190, partial [Bacteroidetes bacterium]|nr:hypothetical protein [Bacteroidota bacterium]